MRSAKKSDGFTLIEVLVSMVIIAIGLLGLAGIQTMIVGNSSTSRIRSIAAILAENLSSAMGVNETYWSSASAPASLTVTGVVSTATCDSTWSSTALSDATLQAKTTSCTSSSCSDGATLAGYDLKYWGCQLATQLPNGSGEVECAATAAGPIACTITVKWAEKNMAYRQSSTVASKYTTQQYQMVTQP